MTAPLIFAEDLVVRLPPRFTLRVERLEIGAGITAVVGANASGKSTLLRALATVLLPTTGTLTIGGRRVGNPVDRTETRRSLGYVPQDDSTPRRLSVFDHVDLVAVMRELGPSARQRRSAVARSLDDFDLVDLATERCGRLSGGQRRRVALAAGLAGHPSLLVLDEPDAHLDDQYRERLGQMLLARSPDSTIVVATHDRMWADALADRTVFVDNGVVSTAA